MSGSMLDAVILEKRGIPAVCIGADHLKLVAVAMSKAQGMPDHPIAVFPGERKLESLKTEDELRQIAKITAPQVEVILVKR